MVGEMLVVPCAELKFFGVSIEDRFNFDTHIDVMYKKVSSGFFKKSV